MKTTENESVSCPICDSPADTAFQKDSYDIRDCRTCGHRFTQTKVDSKLHVDSEYGDAYFSEGGAGYSDYLSEEKLLRDRGRWYGKILNRHAPPGRILDVGAAAGFILQGFVDSGWTGKGIEPNEKMATVARSRLGLDVLTGMLENLPAGDQFDAISIIQVLPHFVDPRQAMSVTANMIRSGGLLLIETWNRSSWTARLLGQHWHEYSPPSVLHWFDPEGVKKLAGGFGFTEIARGRPPKHILAGHAKSLLNHKLGKSLPGRLASRLVNLCPDGVKIPYPAEDLFYMLLRKDTISTN